MTYEEMQRMMEFILEQQAQLTANQQRADERMDRTDERMDKADKRIDRAHKLIIRTAKPVDTLATIMVERVSSLSEELDAKFVALADSQMRTEEVVRRLGEDVRRLTERGEKTDEAVRNLTAVVDRHLRNHRNGERDVSRE